MSLLVCCVPVSPLRSEPSHKSEQVSQLLFGERCTFIKREQDFLLVKVAYDQYEGWCQLSQLEELPEFEEPLQSSFAGEWNNQIVLNGSAMSIPFGSSLPDLKDGRGQLGRLLVEYTGLQIYPHVDKAILDRIEHFTRLFLNTAYLWGGRSVYGIDCSGFTQLVFKCFAVPLLRDASQQASQGEAIGFLQEARCGDLAFFDNKEGKITHVGILLSPDSIIHASGKVRIDTIDNLGIINTETGKRTHQLRIVKRLL